MRTVQQRKTADGGLGQDGGHGQDGDDNKHDMGHARETEVTPVSADLGAQEREQDHDHADATVDWETQSDAG